VWGRTICYLGIYIGKTKKKVKLMYMYFSHETNTKLKCLSVENNVILIYLWELGIALFFSQVTSIKVAYLLEKRLVMASK
jgi:hypothetical protein